MKPQVSLLATNILVGSLFLLKSIINLKVYKKLFTDIVETIVYFNVLALATFSLYDFKADLKKQTAVAYTSTIITLFLFIGVIAYHLYVLIRKEKTTVELDEYPLVPVLNQPANFGSPVEQSEVTYSVVQFPPPEDYGDKVANS